MCAYVCVCVFVCARTCVFVCIFTYMDTHIHKNHQTLHPSTRNTGQTVPESERAVRGKVADNLSSSSSTHNLPSIDDAVAPAAAPAAAATSGEKRQWEEEKMKLYGQLDDKVCFCSCGLGGGGGEGEVRVRCYVWFLRRNMDKEGMWGE